MAHALKKSMAHHFETNSSNVIKDKAVDKPEFKITELTRILYTMLFSRKSDKFLDDTVYKDSGMFEDNDSENIKK